jgi:hypothetical protein
MCPGLPTIYDKPVLYVSLHPPGDSFSLTQRAANPDPTSSQLSSCRFQLPFRGSSYRVANNPGNTSALKSQRVLKRPTDHLKLGNIDPQNRILVALMSYNIKKIFRNTYGEWPPKTERDASG